MKLTVVIPTLGRSKQVARLLTHLEEQTRAPDLVILSAPDAAHVEITRQPERFPLSVVFGKRGLAAQRNTALDAAQADCDIVTFFDDDFVPANDYLERVQAAFADNADYSVVMGRVIRDGANNAGLDWTDALTALADPAIAQSARPAVVDHIGAYGCNMSIRSTAIGALRFDERLVLYGWQEDIDFTSQLRLGGGRVVEIGVIHGVHLGIKAGRVSGERFGYSQIVNPLYLIRKGTVPAAFALRLMIRNIGANLLHSLRPEPYVDRRGRLRGNFLAFLHVLSGRIEPEYILRL